MTPTTRFFLALVLVALAPGCVTRRYLITTEPPGALVYMNGQPIGATPVEQPFIYYGKYKFTLVKDGYQTLDVEPDFCPPYYEWLGFDFVAENINPYQFRDLQAFHYVLQPLLLVRPEDVRRDADKLRRRGEEISPRQTLPAPIPVVPPGGAIPPVVPVPPPSTPPPGPVGVIRPSSSVAPYPAAPSSGASLARPP